MGNAVSTRNLTQKSGGTRSLPPLPQQFQVHFDHQFPDGSGFVDGHLGAVGVLGEEDGKVIAGYREGEIPFRGAIEPLDILFRIEVALASQLIGGVVIDALDPFDGVLQVDIAPVALKATFLPGLGVVCLDIDKHLLPANGVNAEIGAMRLFPDPVQGLGPDGTGEYGGKLRVVERGENHQKSSEHPADDGWQVECEPALFLFRIVQGGGSGTGFDPMIRVSEPTLAFHRETFVVDALALDYVLEETYAQRVLEGGVNAVQVTFAIEEDWSATLAKIEANLKRIEQSALLRFAVTAAGLVRAKQEGRLGVLMGFQGASMIGADLSRLSLLARLGLRCIQLTYTAANLYGDGCGERRNAGLSILGQEFIAAVNELPLLLDLSHCGHATSLEAAELAKAPVVTHANAYAVNANDRNKKDELLRAVAAKDGVIGICALPRPVHPHAPTLGHLLDHLQHIEQIVGTSRVGLGLDFIEGLQDRKVVLPESRRWRTLRPDIFGNVDDFVTQQYPEGIRGIRMLPNLTQRLFDQSRSRDEVAAILGGNWLRVFRRVFDL